MRTRWTNQQAAEDAFSAILDDPKAGTPFDDSWADKVAKSIEAQRKTLNAAILASVIPTGYLALSILGISANAKFLGLEINSQSVLFEGSLLATCLFGMFGAYVSILIGQSDQLLQVWVQNKQPKTAPFYRLVFGPPFFRAPPFANPPGNPTPSDTTKWIKAAGQGGFYFVGISTAAVPLVVQIAAIWLAFDGSFCALHGSKDQERMACEATVHWVAIFATILTVANVLAYVLYALPLRYASERADR